MEQQIFNVINGLAGELSWLDAVGKFFGGDYFFYLIIFAVLALLFVTDKHLQNHARFAASSAVLARGVTEIIKRSVDRLRPYEVLNVNQLIIDTEKGMAFPSGHATIYFAVAFAFWGTKYFWPLFILAVLGSMGRVFVGVHYPLDILGGAIVGGSIAWVVRMVYKKYENKNRPI